MSEYGFDEEEAGLVGSERGGHQSDSGGGGGGGHNYVTVIPVEYQTRQRYGGHGGPDYEAFSRSATISRYVGKEFL